MVTAAAPTRPALRYLGGKWMLAPWIISHFPAHQVYVEPFGGAASVMLRKPKVRTEVYNDLDDEVVNLFRVLRDPHRAEALRHLLTLTPFARSEFFAAYAPSVDPVERARRLIVRSFMGHASGVAWRADRKTGFRPVNNAAHGDPARTWAGYPDALAQIISRMSGVAIESLPAVDLIRVRDGAGTLFYVDPPYVLSTRSSKRIDGEPGTGYRHEMSEDDHAVLLKLLLEVRGDVVVSGYSTPLYNDLLKGWRRVDRRAAADGHHPRLESLWVSPSADEKLSASHAVRREGADA